jgi:type IV pilus assembly protein PilY1
MGASGTRNLFTNLNSSVALSNSSNRVSRNNTAITNAMIGVATNAEREALLDWITWDSNWTPTDPDEESHVGVMGAAFHSQPGVVNYANGDVILLPTSEGVLEAIDANTGEELWAFMPADLLGNIATIKTNDASATPYYGLDGPLTVYQTGSSKMAIFGMRRGGQKYYLLNVTNRNDPVLVREISDSDSNFSQLAQTWSKPVYVKMNIGGSATEVLVFAGGYDADQDNATSRSDDNEGNVIYIVNATNGSLLRSISNSGADINISGMTNSIPSDVTTIDLNGDAVVDRLYASDVGGRVIRVDIDALSGGIIADVNQGTGNYRRFFNSPQVGYYSKGGIQFLAILIGSGNRASPLDGSVSDRFYMIKDKAVWHAPSGAYTTITNSQLLDATGAERTDAEVLDIANGGWFIELSGSEKSYSKAILYDYAVIFTTYSAIRADDLGDCEAIGALGTARVYAVHMVNSGAVFNWNGGSEDNLNVSHRSDTLNMLGIPPSPTLVFPGETDDDGNQVIGKKVHLLVGIEKKREWSDRFRPIYWEEVIDDE